MEASQGLACPLPVYQWQTPFVQAGSRWCDAVGFPPPDTGLSSPCRPSCHLCWAKHDKFLSPRRLRALAASFSAGEWLSPDGCLSRSAQPGWLAGPMICPQHSCPSPSPSSPSQPKALEHFLSSRQSQHLGPGLSCPLPLPCWLPAQCGLIWMGFE